ncbi:flagellar export chaperone FlgN [Paenarthrobacter sp. NPDC058040]|uniref:flagellar export chaperone FlgN n=1 Tax=unclassified Paenarthrobacter TaxID=2634190 RepID=UPI0036D8C75F
MGADELSARLWRERRQLDHLLFVLETQLLHLKAGNWHRLSFTTTELEKVIENLRFDSLARGVEASAMVSEWNEQEQQTLPSLVTIAPSGLWQDLLEEHRRGMSSLLASIDAATAANNSLLLQGPDFVGSVQAGLNETVTNELAVITLETNIQRALSAVASASLPAVREFLEG